MGIDNFQYRQKIRASFPFDPTDGLVYDFTIKGQLTVKNV